MDPRTFPTKGNLILAKNSLALANQGYELMDKKRNILIRELMDLIDQAKEIQEKLIRHSHMLINVCSVRTSNMGSISYLRLPTPFQLKNQSGSKAEVLWEQKFHWSLIRRRWRRRLILSVRQKNPLMWRVRPLSR